MATEAISFSCLRDAGSFEQQTGLIHSILTIMDHQENQHEFASEDESERVSRMLNSGKFHELLALARHRMQSDASTPVYPAIVGTCYIQLHKFQEAKRFLLKQVTRFPDSCQLHFELGQAYLALHDPEEAEKAYLHALEIVGDTDKELKSSYLTSLGGAYWDSRKRKEALVAWQEALALDPSNDAAKEMLRLHTNQYGEPSSPTPVFDDVYHFQNIQTDKYFHANNKKGFADLEEANRINGLITRAWNDFVAPRKKELDRMSAAEKTEVYSAVKIDFSGADPFIGKMQFDESYDGDSIEDMPLSPDGEIDEVLNELGRMLPFLPPDGAISLMFAVPALVAVGLPFERLEVILKGDPPTEEEEDQLVWAYDIVEAVHDALEYRGTDAEVDAMMDAVAITAEELEPNLAPEVVRTIHTAILMVEQTLTKHPPRKKRKKKKKR